MSRKNQVNPDHYKVAGRLSPDDLARERVKQDTRRDVDAWQERRGQSAGATGAAAAGRSDATDRAAGGGDASDRHGAGSPSTEPAGTSRGARRPSAQSRMAKPRARTKPTSRRQRPGKPAARTAGAKTRATAASKKISAVRGMRKSKRAR